MNILLLGKSSKRLDECFVNFGDDICVTTEKLNVNSSELANSDLILSYGYRHILASDIIDKFPHRIINMHISYLPWNRGADCNLWSFLDDTEKGVSIHHMDAGLDTGKLIVQRHVKPTDYDTLRTSYQRLKDAVENLLIENWAEIRLCKLIGKVQAGVGSYHRSSDKNAVQHFLDDGWDTPVKNLRESYLAYLESQ